MVFCGYIESKNERKGEIKMDRRYFIKGMMGITSFGLALPKWGNAAQNNKNKPSIMTVSGEISPAELGMTLTHEHVLVDFIGADKISPDRYDQDEAFQIILPYLEKLKPLGIRGFIECTPAYIGRDPVLLKRLADQTGLHILTNTGYYGAANDKFVPDHAYQKSSDELATRWINEWENGIENTNIRPGFIKIGVDSTSLSDIDAKLVKAAAKTHLATGLTIASHTGPAIPAFQEIEILETIGVDASAFIWVHAQNESNHEKHIEAAQKGAWISFDGIGPNSINAYVNRLKALKSKNLLNQVLLSHDAGWYSPGEPSGGNYRGYETISTTFIPALKNEGFTQEDIDMVMIKNPQNAFSIQIRKRTTGI